jgi:hypothetical protein
MKTRNIVHVLAILFATAAISADNKGSGTDKAPAQSTCVNQCAASEQRCSRAVRRARTDCQRVAANGGRDVFTGRPAGSSYNGIDYGAFCSYFANPDASCGAGYYRNSCQQRLAYRHGVCLDAMDNIAQLRYDCFRTERDANNQCREDLRECKASCQ